MQTLWDDTKYSMLFDRGRGHDERTWIVHPPRNGGDEFKIDPTKQIIIMHNCRLINQRERAQRVFASGGNMELGCAWVECTHVEVRNRSIYADPHQTVDTEIKYNPLLHPYWIFQGEPSDFRHFEEIITHDYKLYATILG
jgi:hypothetical protein